MGGRRLAVLLNHQAEAGLVLSRVKTNCCCGGKSFITLLGHYKVTVFIIIILYTLR